MNSQFVCYVLLLSTAFWMCNGTLLNPFDKRYELEVPTLKPAVPSHHSIVQNVFTRVVNTLGESLNISSKLPEEHGISLLWLIQGEKVTPISSNSSREEQLISNVTIAPHIEWVSGLEYPFRRFYSNILFRRPVVEVNETEVVHILNCSISDRLPAHEESVIIAQIVKYDHQINIFIFLNGKLRQRCDIITSDYLVFDNLNDYVINKYLHQTDNSLSFQIMKLMYWPFRLSYDHIQSLSLPSSVRQFSQLKEFEQGRSWFQREFQSISATQWDNICFSSNETCSREHQQVQIVFWPYFYVVKQPPRPNYFYKTQITESLFGLLRSLEHTQAAISTFEVVIPVSSIHREMFESLLNDAIFRSAKATVVLYEIATTKTSYSGIMNEICKHNHNERFIVSLFSHIYLEKDWISPLVSRLADNDIVGTRLLTPSGELYGFGYEYFEVDYITGMETLLVPHHKYRGYWPNDVRTSNYDEKEEGWGTTKYFMAFQRSAWEQLGGFDEAMSPLADDADFSLRGKMEGLRLYIEVNAVGVSLLSLLTNANTDNEYTSEAITPLKLNQNELQSLRTFTEHWQKKYFDVKFRRGTFISDAKLTWVIHCGGSQGLEAATILQQLYKYIDVRTLVRRYRQCEHSDTLSGMPAYFRDILEFTAYRSFTKQYQSFVSGNFTNEDDELNDGSIVLYARDYREAGRWIPRDTSYVIGRYMFETDALPQSWVIHCNALDEVWVPSKWQYGTFESSGVKSDKMFVMPETVDSYYFSPEAVQPLELPGTILDGYARHDINRPYAFCSVFKMEDRKGWQELVSGFVRAFTSKDKVALILRTYMHSGKGISESDFSHGKIREHITDYLSEMGLPYDEASSPRIEIVSEHLPSWQLVMFYKACDAFVLPTHAEGWGLPTHEAMIMELPVITTNWGGSTEFVTPESGLLINTLGLTPTTTDDWLKGFMWAKVDVNHLILHLKSLYRDREFGRALGIAGRKHIMQYSPTAVAKTYSERISDIYLNKAKSMTTTFGKIHGEVVTSRLDLKWSLTSRFKTCAIMNYKTKTKSYRSLGYYSDYVAGKNFVPMRNNSNLQGSSHDDESKCFIAIVTTWEPRKCGIATFSAALRDGLLKVCPTGSVVDVIVVKHQDQSPDEYDENVVKYIFNENEALSYIDAAQYMNERGYHTVYIQYEFGMLYGDHLMCMLRELKTPNLITTVHTVSRDYPEYNHAYVQQMILMSSKIIVMTHSMRHVLSVFHAIPTRHVHVIPHGGVNIPYLRKDGTDLQTVFPGKKVILSNGLIHPYKGLEFMIKAMPIITTQIPDAIYLIHGTPHPSGTNTKEYYQYLLDFANATAPTSVFFNNSFATDDELLDLLQNAAIYVNPYTDPGQSVSGTLAMALAVGTVSVSTPYSYAVEMLGRTNVGRLVPYRDHVALAEVIIELLTDDNRRKQLSSASYQLAQSQTWEKVATGYLNLATN